MAEPPTGPPPEPTLTPPPLQPQMQLQLPRVLQRLLRIFLGVTGSVCALTTLMLLLSPASTRPGGAITIAFGLLAGLSLLSMRLPSRWLAPALLLVLAATALTRAANAWSMGWGLASPTLSTLGLTICALGAVAGWRYGSALAAVSLATVLGLALTVPTPAAAGSPSESVLLSTAITAILVGLAAGAIISSVLGRFIQRSRERSRRFRHLLALAADIYWEVDRQGRLVATSSGSGSGQVLPLIRETSEGPVVWELPQFSCEPEVLVRLRADVAARRAFRDLPLFWSSRRDGRRHAYLASGEPRFDELGAFAGYWGVGRNVSQVLATREELKATETRYRDLFTHIPTPLLVHRGGIIIEANSAAAALFGHAEPASLVGTDLHTYYEDEDSRQRAFARRAELERAPAGATLPLAQYKLRVQGRQLAVRATSVRVQIDGQPAMLAIFIDDTEKLAADEALRRSEGLLSHLFNTSPDLITLTEIETGRYAMVNRAFEQTSGWSAAEAVGHTSLELGVWGRVEDRQRFVAALHDHGAVNDLPVSFVGKSGRQLPMVVSAARFQMERRDYMVINARDVSERERQRLEREAILANASIGIAVTRDQRFVLANRHMEQLYGWGPGELVGQSGRVVWLDDEAYSEVGREVGPALARGEPVELERPGRRKDGRTFIARMRARAIDPERPREGGTVWIIEDVTERRQFEQALARARDDAEAASRAKSAFLANTSHELRTPLNGMIGLARLARDEATDEVHRRQYLDQVVESAQSLAGIISDILDLSKIEAGKLQIETTAFDLAGLMQTLQRTYSTLAAAHGLVLRLEAEPGLEGPVLGDPLRVRQVVSNFLSNAIKFTPAGQVLLRAARLPDANWVRLAVQDSGPGIDAALRTRLFQPFTQADESTTRRFGGTGLGLSICHELVALMGGRIGVDNSDGGGSAFWAELPLPHAGAVLAPAPPPAAGGHGLAGLRVLMAEDNAVNMMIAVALLERWGAQVGQAHDGRAALAAVEAAAAEVRPFDAVLMDVQMPLMSGHEAARELRRAGHRMPVIALTAAALVTERDAALQAGMDDFLTKPVDADRLYATLLRWCRPGVPPAGSGS